jgi:hypothetical protein
MVPCGKAADSLRLYIYMFSGSEGGTSDDATAVTILLLHKSIASFIVEHTRQANTISVIGVSVSFYRKG